MFIEHYSYFLPENAHPEDWYLLECFRVLTEQEFKLIEDPFKIGFLYSDVFLSKKQYCYEIFSKSTLNIKHWKQIGCTKESMVLNTPPDTVKRQTDIGDVHLLIVTKVSDPSAGPQEYEKHNSIKGLITTIFGRNMLYEHEFSHILNKDNITHTISSEIREPFLYESVDRRIEKCFNPTFMERFKNIDSFSTEIRNKVLLSARWINNSSKYDSEIDELVSIWIAIETLCLSNDSNILPIQVAFQSIYPEYQEKDHFKIGILYKLRCDIVHTGLQRPLFPGVIEFARAIYYDLLLYKVGLDSERYTERLVSDTCFDIQVYYKEYFT